MITIRKAAERGTTITDWLDGKHTFSFGHYHDLKHMGFGVLRVINEDRVKPDSGFSPHAHQDMEIITYILEGELTHKDSLGNGSIIKSGEMQRMSAGTGITHSEMNASHDQWAHLLQIWIIPERKGITPGYEQKSFLSCREPGKLTLVASRDGRENSLTIHQDISLSILDLDKEQSYIYDLNKDRMLWVQIMRGSGSVEDKKINQGDGIEVLNQSFFKIVAQERSEILIFDLKNQDLYSV